MSLSVTGSSTSQVSTQTTKQQGLGQDDFFKILTAQLMNQNPTEPLDNAQFVAQMAQFSTASAVQDMKGSLGDMQRAFVDAQQLQAAGLVGRTALAPGNQLLSAGQGAPGAFELAGETSATTVLITAPDGRLVRHIPLGGLSAGIQGFEWDGRDDQGNLMPAGGYQVQVQALNNGAGVEANPYTRLNIRSVSLQPGQAPQLALADGRTIPLSEIREIM